MCKRIFVIMLMLVVFGMMQADAQQLNYQAIARNANGVALTFRDVGIRLSIRDGSPNGSIVYSESRNIRTNQFGLFTVIIGSPGASNVLGSMASINWISGNKYLQVEIDPEGGTNYFQAGTSQLQAVPYALFANAAYPVGPAGGDLLGSTYPNPIIAPLAVTTGKIANQAITTPKIADLNVTTPKLADQAVTNAKIQDNTIANIKLVNSRVTLNGLILNLGDAQEFAIGTNGIDVNIVSAGNTHTFNFPNASIANRGLITPNAQTIGGNKTFNNDITAARIIRAGGLAAQFLKADGSVDNNIYLTENQPIIVTATGDATGVSTSSRTAPVLPLTLATVNSAVGTYGTNIVVPSITVNNKGLVTNVIANPIPTATAITSGLLTVGDWNIFNNKQNAIPLGSATQYFRGDLTLSNFQTDVRDQLSAGTNITYANGNIGLTNNSVTLNTLPLTLGGSQTFATGTTGVDFNISSAGSVHTFNIPTASVFARGLINSTDYTNFNAAYNNRIASLTTTGTSGAATLSGNVLNIPNYTYTLPAATATTLGGIIPGANITNTSGTISLTSNNVINALGSQTANRFLVAPNGANGLPSFRAMATEDIPDNIVTNNKLLNKSITLNGIAVELGSSQTFATSNLGLDFSISSSSSTHTFNIPSASSTARGLLTNGDWNTFNSKQNTISGTGYAKWTGAIPAFSSTIPLTTDVSGTLPAANFGVLTGDVTNTAGSYATTISNDAITTAKILTGNVTNDKLQFKSITLNGISVDLGSAQTFAIGSTGTDFNINSATSTHTFNFPSASATNRGLLTSTDWTTFNSKQNTISGTGYAKWTGAIPAFSSTIPLTTDVSGTLPAANFGGLTGDVTNTAGSYGTTISNNAITTAKILNGNVTNEKLLNKSITLNGISVDLGSAQTFAIGSTGTDFNINSATSTHTFNFPSASATNRGLLTSADWTTFNSKQNLITQGTTAQYFKGDFSLGNFQTDVRSQLSAGTSISYLNGIITNTAPMTYPGVGIALSDGANWLGSITNNSTNWNTAFDDRLKWDGGSTDLNATTGRSSLGGTTIGSSYFTLPNPDAITFPRMNVNNTVSALSAADFRTAIGASTVGANYFTLTNPSAITFPRMNVDNTVSALSAADFRTAIGVNGVADGWNINGNSTITSTNFLGTTNNVSLIFKVGNTFAGEIHPASTSILNTSFGLGSNSTINVGGIQNSAFGAGALSSNTLGDDNTAIGQAALATNTVGTSNTAIGQNALYNSKGDHNTAVGQAALRNNGNTIGNTAVGRAALEANSTGGDNTSMGHLSLLSHTSGSSNTALGKSSLTNLTSGSNNVALGFESGANIGALGTTNLTSLDNSVLIGYRARPLNNTTTNEIVIGHNAVGLGSNTVQLGNSSTTRVNTIGSVSAGKFVGNNSGTGVSYNSTILSTGTGTSVVPTLSGNDVAGVITFKTGLAPTGIGDFITLTFGSPYSTNSPVVIIQPVINGTAKGIVSSIYCLPSNTTTLIFKITTDAELIADTEYQIAYHILGR